MTSQTVEQEIRELEGQYWSAIRDQNVEAALRLTDDPCIVTGAQGVASIGHEAFKSMAQSEMWQLHRFELGDDMQVKMVGQDIAIVAYTVKEHMTVEGKPLELEAADASVWVRKGGRWVCCLHTESIKGDPFGRDRHPPS
jgi:ketosteroid isomerase-like protein